MKDTIKFLQPAVSGVALGQLAATTADIAHALELGALTRLCAETSARVGNSHLTGSENPNRRNFVRKSVPAPSRHKCLTDWHIPRIRKVGTQYVFNLCV